MRRLTIKQNEFIKEVARTRNPTQAVLKIYDVKNNNVARNIASTNLTKPNIRLGLEKLLSSSGYDPRLSIANLISVEQAETKKITGADKINASKLLLQLSGYMMQGSVNANYNFNIDTMDHGNLINAKEKYAKLRKKLEDRKNGSGGGLTPEMGKV